MPKKTKKGNGKTGGLGGIKRGKSGKSHITLTNPVTGKPAKCTSVIRKTANGSRGMLLCHDKVAGDDD